MLVLSRRPDEKIILPSVPAVLQVISIHGGLVRIGIQAPTNVPILREELARADQPPEASSRSKRSSSESRPRNLVPGRLDKLILGLTLLRTQCDEKDPSHRDTLDRLEQELQSLQRQVMGTLPHSDPAPLFVSQAVS